MLQQIFGPFGPLDAVVLTICLGTVGIGMLFECLRSPTRN